ncbi:MAG: translational GTPase TypA [Alphaproteobacteria bacterium]|nr:translational GTPase TypA [Alphaproteobacteria bacterium]MCK5518355.1 translational GTPase TypA [Alphaproteobacteria bacterium]
MTSNLKNIAIIAHVDHGKTTLVDVLLRQSGLFRENQKIAECVMDNNDLERERGITILAKVTSVVWKDTRINIVDTPGHADFGGEVERILSMVDGVIVLVDAAEGPLPQTKFVVDKALKQGIRPIVVINKIDRPDARPHEVHEEIFDLFAALDATDEQLDFPMLYASGRDGWASATLDGERSDMIPLFDLICDFVPSPKNDVDAPFSMLVTLIENNSYLGRLVTGKVMSGSIKLNAPVKALTLENKLVETSKITKILAFRGINREPLTQAKAGDIISLAGMTLTTVSDTICDMVVEQALPAVPIDPPTISMSFAVNDGPFAGTEGTKITSRIIRERLFREAESNVAMKVRDGASSDVFEVFGRGELQMAILIETMRREGFELCIGRPRVVYKTDEETGEKLEPIEEIMVDVDQEYSGQVVQKMAIRKGEMVSMMPSGAGRVRMTFIAPTRGLIGYHGEFLTDTRGTGVINRLFHGYAPFKGGVESRRTGVLLAMEKGEATEYDLWKLEERGIIMILPGTRVYEGMIVGEHSRGNDLPVNVLKGKKLTNVRASGTDEATKLVPPRILTLDQAIIYIADDELAEITPKTIRLRKRILNSTLRKRAGKVAKVG